MINNMESQNIISQRIPLKWAEDAPITAHAPIEIGVPIEQAQANSIGQFQLLCNGERVKCAARPLSYWQDGSIKWVELVFFACPSGERNYELIVTQTANKAKDVGSGLLCTEVQIPLQIQNDRYIFKLDKEQFGFSLAASSDHSPNSDTTTSGVTFVDGNNQSFPGCVTDLDIIKFHDVSDDAIQVIKLCITGYYGADKATSLAEFHANLTFYYQQSCIKFEFTLHNPRAALHSGGNWDLGDPGSVFFNALNFDLLSAQTGEVSWQTQPQSDWQDANEADIQLQQYSSGGENWHSPIHLDHTKQIPFNLQGYQVSRDGSVIAQGQRATPSIWFKDSLGCTLDGFWQNFPKSIAIEPGKIRFGLFPQQADTRHELQGGEKKTHTLWLNVAGEQASLEWVHDKPRVVLPWQSYQPSASYLYINEKSANAPLRSLICNALDSDNNFYNKRETVDQYGWRHFGDLYADHETAGYQGQDIFVSHYNNQYDPIFGFLRQYMIDGDKRWFVLADDLAKHVTDIDIYHTEEDKKEYNGGLFWHTDHYLQAFTSSHRSYSKHQASGAYQDHAGGGGPGGQHCYTSGLMLHFLMTGNESSKQAVLTLCDWITHVYEGSNTCLELLLAFKNRHVLGLKNHFTGQYPLDRGTANYIIALLDSYELTQQADYLQRVEHILFNTMHPDEDLAQRQLLDVEKNWFYTVILQALIRYLHVKEGSGELDNKFYYARDCLLNFAQWMLEHEYLYLEKPEILEYPNDTWTAQDLRKAHVFAAASYFSNNLAGKYMQKAHYFEREVYKRLTASNSKTYTRILALMMQNHGATDYYSTAAGYEFAPREQAWPLSSYQTTSLAKGLPKALIKRLQALSIGREIDWLKKRLG